MTTLSKLKWTQLVGASTLALLAATVGTPSVALAAGASLTGGATDSTAVDAIIVTGTRETQVQARRSLSVIEVISTKSLSDSGATNLQDALERVLPSLNQPGFGADHSNLVKAVRLRGLSPDQTLILINGKRRHNSALLNLDAGPVAGSDPVDLNLIPVSAIDHIEVLEDGAAAQYGSDAIAGVINIILKSSADSGSASATTGAYYKGDGIQVGGAFDKGFALGENGFVHLSATAVNNASTNRSGPDLLTTSGNADTNKVLGTPRNNIETLGFNAGEKLGGGIDLYSFGTAAHRYASSYETYHGPDGDPVNNGGIGNSPAFYPAGYIPQETIDEWDYALTGGVKGEALAGWSWDLSTTYGRDFERSGLTNSLNQSLGNTSPTSFFMGDSVSSEWTSNLDLKRAFDVGFLAAPLTVAVGAEHRYDGYQIRPGDPASYIQGTVNPTGRPGSIGDFGFMPSVAVSPHRNSVSAYADLSTAFTTKWRGDLAGRFEHYSDFGDAETGKFATRYDFSEKFGLRATVQTGFRAPSLAQEDYALTQTGPALFPGGPHLVQVQLPVESAQALALGSKPLKPEKSESYSLGFVGEPLTGLRVTADVYEVDIQDRITNSGLLLLGTNPAGTEFDVASFFTNGLSTRSRGVELTADYTTRFSDDSSIRWSLNANYNKILITKVAKNPLGLQLFTQQVVANITSATPDTKVILGADYQKDKWHASIHETILGSAYSYVTADAVNYSLERFTPHFLTDLEISYKFNPTVTLTAGANNLFNIYPNRVNPTDNGAAQGIIYPTWSPIGINGGFYYTRVSFNF